MALKFFTGFILCALLHFGTASYSVWENDRESVFNATLDIYKSINIDSNTSNFEEASKLLGSKLYSLIDNIQGMSVSNFDNSLLSRMSEVVQIISLRENDPILDRAQEEVYKNSLLFVNHYSWFLTNDIYPNETQLMIKKALALDHEQSLELSETMTEFFGLYLNKYRSRLLSYNNIFATPSDYLGVLLQYNVRNEWNAFMMITTAYKLISLEAKDDQYIHEFDRLKEQLVEKLKIHEAQYFKALYQLIHEKSYQYNSY